MTTETTMTNRQFTHASLFSGIGGFDLAAEWMGWHNAFHCEINPFALKVLKYHFPKATTYEDITTTDFTQWRGKIDILTGGFPCQPFSLAGKRKGAEDDRYLWPQMLRAIREINPAWVVGENVAGITTMVQPGETVEMGRSSSLFREDYKDEELRQQYVIETVCADLEREGYSVQPILIPACAVGAPHRRDRVWFIARRIAPHPDGNGSTARTPCKRVEASRWQHLPQPGERGNTTERIDGLHGLPWDDSNHAADTDGKKLQGWFKIGGFPYKEEDRTRVVLGIERPCGLWHAPYANSELPQCGNHERQKGRDIPEIRTESFDSKNCWQNFPTQPPVCCRDDGFSSITHIRTIQEDNTMDRTGIIMKCLNEGRIITNPSTGEIFSTKIRGHEGQKIKLCGSLCNGYIVHSLKYKGIQKQVRAHQVIWMSVHGEYDKDNFQIDHINRNREDNRIENLRLVTAKENMSNQSRYDGKFTKDDKLNMLLLHNESTMSMREIAELYGCRKSRVHQIICETQSRLDGINFPKWREESVKAYGNAIVPQVAYEIFKAIQQFESHETNQ